MEEWKKHLRISLTLVRSLGLRPIYLIGCINILLHFYDRLIISPAGLSLKSLPANVELKHLSHLPNQWFPLRVFDKNSSLQALIKRPVRAPGLCAADSRVLQPQKEKIVKTRHKNTWHQIKNFYVPRLWRRSGCERAGLLRGQEACHTFYDQKWRPWTGPCSRCRSTGHPEIKQTCHFELVQRNF